MIEALKPRLSPDQVQTLLRLGAATVHEAQNQTGAMVSAIKPVDPARRVAGPALTVRAQRGDNLVLHHALRQAKRGDVVVVDAQACVECGLWGDILTLAAQSVGVAGLIIDGAVRDGDGIISLGFPVFTRGLSIKGPRKHANGVINSAITCGGADVYPGDIVVGDRDGVVVVPRSKLQAVLEAGLRREASEWLLREGIEAGHSTVELLRLPARTADDVRMW